MKKTKAGVLMLLLGLICINEQSGVLASQQTIQNKLNSNLQQLEDDNLLMTKSSIKNRLNSQLSSRTLSQSSLSKAEAKAQAFIAGLSQEQLLQTSQLLQADGDEQQPVADEQAAQVQDVQQTADPAAAEQAQQAEAQPQAEQQVQAQVDETAQAQAQAQVEAQGQVDQQAQLQAQAQAQAEAEAQAQAQAQAEAEAQAQAAAAAAPKKPRGRQNVQVAATADVNQAVAVAQAAAALIPEEKPFNKMNAAEKKAHLAKLAKEKAEKAAKEARENPTVDENGEHIQTVAEAKAEARQLQEMLVAGEQAVDQKIAMEQAQLAAMPATPAEPVKQEEDDGHVETVEEVKAKMAAAQAAMDQGLQETDNRVQQMAQENASMPNFGALADLHGSISNMGRMRKQKQLQDMASKLGVEIQAGEEQMDANDLTNTLIERAKQAGKSEADIQQALTE